jgi:hypothetical protein
LGFAGAPVGRKEEGLCRPVGGVLRLMLSRQG